MLVAQALRLLLRRWRLVLVTLLVAVLGAGLATFRVSPSYETQTSLLFLSPGTVPSTVPGGESRRINPFVNFTQDLFVARDVVSARLSGDDVYAELEQAGLRGDYDIAPSEEGSAPILVVTVFAATPQDATSSARLISDRVQQELDAQQQAAQAPSDSFITSTVINPPQEPIVVRKAQLQAGLIAFAGLVVLGLLLIAADERRRAVRRAQPVPPAPPAPPAPPDDAGAAAVLVGQGSWDEPASLRGASPHNARTLAGTSSQAQPARRSGDPEGAGDSARR